MPAKSKSQQRLFALVHAYQAGKIDSDKVSDKIKDMAKRVDKKDARDFASTKTSKLPDKVASPIDYMFIRGFISRFIE